MPNPDGSHTATEHRAAILALYRINIANGMEPEVAMACAGREWRNAIKKDGEIKLAKVKAWLAGDR